MHRASLSLSLALALCLAAGTAAAEGDRLPLLGLQFNGGLPQGGVASLLVRPVKPLRLDVGYAHNYLAQGIQGGVTLVPFHWAIVPTLRGEVGRFFKGDIGSKVSRFVDDVPDYLEPALNGFGYDYASAQLGLELGSQRSFVFFVRAGIAWVRFRGVSGTFQPDEGNPDIDVRVEDLKVRFSGPTANLGFLFYIW
jgi:hypothetical protein